MQFKIPNAGNARLQRGSYPIQFGRGAGVVTPTAPTISSVVITPSSGSTTDEFTATVFYTSPQPYPAPALTYQWKLDTVNEGTNTMSHTPSGAGDLTVYVTATNATGTDNATSAGVTVSLGGIGDWVVGSSFVVE